MKHITSLIACFIICITLLQYRVVNSDMNTGQPPLKVTVWDAFGYYVYLPALFIYHDSKQLKWLDTIDKKYAVTGGDGIQAQKLDNGNYVFKYLGGVAILEIPLFVTAHIIAKATHYPADGFSPPYQYTLGFGIILYCFLAVLLLRKILLNYFSELTTTITLLVVCLATNFIQYAAVDNGQSHAYIFPLYVLVMYTTMRWHHKPAAIWALLTGYIIGLATICRPTEAIMLFIPLMWDTQNKTSNRAKWELVKQNKPQIILAAMGGIAGILPQLLYWKAVTGSFIYDVGSKWEFLNPHLRLLFGWEKGWFIYTPVTILFIGGMFFMKQFPFRKSVLWFCLLNIYIIIAWHDWRYGGSYSTRALMQSYGIFALPFAAITERISKEKWQIGFYVLCAFFLLVNLFQTWQYDQTILHYNDMNRLYYESIYLNPNPGPIEMSLLDNDEVLKSETIYKASVVTSSVNADTLHFSANSADTFVSVKLNAPATDVHDSWLKIMCIIRAPGCLWQTYMNVTLQAGNQTKAAKVRLFNAISHDTIPNVYACYMHIPAGNTESQLKLFLTSPFTFNGVVEKVFVERLDK